MDALTELIRSDMKPALGVTEPGAIAFAVATARRHTAGNIEKVELSLNSGMFKNAFTCGIPGSPEVGNYHAAALGASGADPDKGLECLEGITPEQAEEALRMVESGMIAVSMCEITSRIFIEAAVTTDEGSAVVTIRDAHTNIVKITENGKTVFSRDDSAGHDSEEESPDVPLIHKYTLDELYRYAAAVPAEEIGFIRSAFELNMALLQEGLESGKTTFGPYLLAANGGQIVSSDEQRTASLMCNGAIEARVLGLSRPAMSITGSGAHGIIAAMPLYAAYKVSGYTEEQLLRATALSYLICMYIKEYSGKLSAFCGCAIAAGTGMACGLAMMKGAGPDVMRGVINNMASSITGMICDGGNQGCTMKGIVAVDAAWQSVALAMQGVYIFDVHGINGHTPEETMRNMGLIASPGMIGTEKTIVDILQDKQRS
ncbi:MAG: serine dehydratase subunit alpha family protein [Mogibacterium sp.]|nr:serine dehydratase subunit alpha family protein [Mogibacterium sp.]